MDFKDSIAQLAERIAKQKDSIATEEATKNAFIMPFIAALGYDVFNPFEVVPEVDCDLNKKKGEKIDYAIKNGDETTILIECKHCAQNLSLHDTQLRRYFVATNARFGVLTNGIEYRFYTDLDKPNLMDEKPFLVVDLLNFSDADVEQLKKFHKSYYDLENILGTAQELKYTTQLRSVLAREFSSPSPDFVRYITKHIYDGQVNQKVIDQFTPLIKSAIAGLVNEMISDRLGLAMKTQPKEAAEVQPAIDEDVSKVEDVESLPDGVVYKSEDGSIVTTQDEIDAYLIVKAILCSVVDVSRIAYRDAQTYFAILLDDSNRKTICRFYFNAKSVKYIALFNEKKEMSKHEIQSLDDIYKFSEELRATISRYDVK
jgi:hypothetical protein